MARDILTDAQVEEEIERLTHDEYVRLARAEVRIKYQRRQYMYNLRNMQKRGMELDAQGYTLETISDMMKPMTQAFDDYGC